MLKPQKDKTKAEVYYEMGLANYAVANALNQLLVYTLKANPQPHSKVVEVMQEVIKRRDEAWNNCRNDAMAILKDAMGNPYTDTPWPKSAEEGLDARKPEGATTT